MLLIRAVLLFGLLMQASLIVQAAVYKRVDQNGNVTYTDKPASEGEAKAESDHQKKIADLSVISGANVHDAADAASAVWGLSQSVEGFVRFCSTQVPDTSINVQSARKVWYAKHGTLVEKSKAILQSKLTPQKFNLLASELDRATGLMMSSAARASASEKLSVCRAVPARLSSAQMDISANTKIVDLILNYSISK